MAFKKTVLGQEFNFSAQTIQKYCCKTLRSAYDHELMIAF